MEHQGHRNRMKERFRAGGLESFAPHEVLELLLFYAIPQKDVNSLAHQLLDTFGSLHGVFEATPEQLTQVPGIGNNAATLLSLILPLHRRYLQSVQGKKVRLDSRGASQTYCQSLLTGQRTEHFYVIGLDANMYVVGNRLVAHGDISEVPAYPRQVVEAVLKLNAHHVILCHNHPGGSLLPSPGDRGVTRQLVEALGAIGVMVMDHVIVSNQGTYSMSKHGDMDEMRDSFTQKAADSSGRIAPIPPKFKNK